ncbi:unnamed protein product, partial [Nesidiocoris tenuis]
REENQLLYLSYLWKDQSSDTNNSFLPKIELIIVACRTTKWSERVVKTFKESNKLNKFKIGSVELPQIAKNATREKSHQEISSQNDKKTSDLFNLNLDNAQYFRSICIFTTEPVLKLFGPLRKVQPNGPLVNSEFYTGWLSYWGDPLSTVDTNNIIRTMRDLIEANVSFNCYMIHGGTNFGFTSESLPEQVLPPPLGWRPVLQHSGHIGKSGPARNCSRNHEREQLRERSQILTLALSGLVSQFQGCWCGNRHSRLLCYGTAENKALRRKITNFQQEEISVLAYTVINETPMPSTMKTGMNLTLIVENQGRQQPCQD